MTPEQIPITDLTRRYLKLKTQPSALRLAEAEAMTAGQLAQEFNDSAAAFRELSFGQWFYDTDPATRDADKDEKSSARTYGWAMDIERSRTVTVDGGTELDFAYLDREIVPTRTKPALAFDAEDGASVRIDLILANAHSGRPIIGELKIASDKDPYTGLVQALAAAAQMNSAGQRARLDEHSEREGLHHRLLRPLATSGDDGAIDVYVLLADFPKRGRDRFAQLDLAAELSRELERDSLADGLGRIRILTVSKASDGSVIASTKLPRPG